MNEERTRINGQDDNGIYGLHVTDNNNRLVVHLHGMTHDAESLLSVTSAEYFVDKGFDHYRISFYAGDADSRKFDKSTLKTHVKDVHSVLDQFRSAYKEIFITAHSLSGLVTLIANPKGVTAMSLWDPSTDVTNFWASNPNFLTAIPGQNTYRLDYGTTFTLNKAMVEEIKSYPDAECLKLARQMPTPTQLNIPKLWSIFHASPHTSPEAYKKAPGGISEVNKIDGADHCFGRIGNRKPLFDHTHRFFKRFSQFNKH